MPPSTDIAFGPCRVRLEFRAGLLVALATQPVYNAVNAQTPEPAPATQAPSPGPATQAPSPGPATPAPSPGPAAAPGPSAPPLPTPAAAVASQGPALFTVGDIRIEGLQRISEGTVFNYLPVNIGDRLDSQRIGEAMRALYTTGFFRDVELRRDGNTLLVVVVERPSIAKFELSAHEGGTQIVFDHTGFPSEEAQHLSVGWQEHYWDALNKFFAVTR